MTSTSAMVDNSTPPTRLLRVTVFNTRKAELTNAQYIEHWLTTHQTIAAPWLIRAGFLEYRQVKLFGSNLLDRGQHYIGSYHT